MSPTPVEMPGDQSLPGNGVPCVGSNGKIHHSPRGGMPPSLPGELLESVKSLAPAMERSQGIAKNGIWPARPGKFPRRGLAIPVR